MLDRNSELDNLLQCSLSPHSLKPSSDKELTQTRETEVSSGEAASGVFLLPLLPLGSLSGMVELQHINVTNVFLFLSGVWIM